MGGQGNQVFEVIRDQSIEVIWEVRVIRVLDDLGDQGVIHQGE